MLNYEVVICQKIHGNLLAVPEKTDQMGFLHVYLDKFSFGFVEHKFCGWDGDCLFESLEALGFLQVHFYIN